MAVTELATATILADPKAARAVRIGVLGPVVCWVGPAAVPLGGPKDRGLIAMLALASPRGVSEFALIDGLWGDDPPRTVDKVLQNLVARLRKRWRDAGANVAVIETVPGGYRLALGPDAVDTGVVEAMAAAGRNALESGASDRASELLAGALACWRGGALADVAQLPFASGARSRLEELRWALFEQRVAADLNCGRSMAVIPELREAVVAAPLREQLWELLLMALSRVGDQAGAAAAFENLRNQLAEDLGLSPGSRLVALKREIAGPEPGDVRPLVQTGPPVVAARDARHQDVPHVAKLLAVTGLVTVIGPGGVGKSGLAGAVAASVAEDYRDGVVVVDLAAVDHELSVVPAVMRAVGAVAINADETLASLVRRLVDRELLIVLDNCEHVIGGAAVLAETLTQRCPRLHLLATSREALRIDGEAIWRLAPRRARDPAGP